MGEGIGSMQPNIALPGWLLRENWIYEEWFCWFHRGAGKLILRPASEQKEIERVSLQHKLLDMDLSLGSMSSFCKHIPRGKNPRKWYVSPSLGSFAKKHRGVFDGAGGISPQRGAKLVSG